MAIAELSTSDVFERERKRTPVFERDSHLPNKTCVESYKSKEIENVADALPDVRDTSSLPFRISLFSSTSSYPFCLPDESDSRETQSPGVKSNTTVNSFVEEACVQAEFQNDTQEDPPFHSEDNDENSENVENRKGDFAVIEYDDKAANVKCPKDDVDEIAVDNSCAWFWWKTHKDEAISVKIVENPKCVRKINKEEPQTAAVSVFERDPHTFNTTSVESCKSQEIERVADTLPDVHVEEGKRKPSKIAKPFTDNDNHDDLKDDVDDVFTLSMKREQPSIQRYADETTMILVTSEDNES
ncbi:hypothetical protein DPMN_093375 [Dreissena polymorpha]|uniref:Uncharacterized protein n=1 Tax=Dreissena polymorpha TaxID=45954 RepID=A0A9D4L3Y4_DREPO|nr:hypothetical protein DPMN_093375 [Dreissena polymorpha]